MDDQTDLYLVEGSYKSESQIDRADYFLSIRVNGAWIITRTQ